MEFIYLLILAQLTVDAVPMRLNIQESVNLVGYPINTPMYYYVSPFELNGPSGMESKLSLSDKTLGLFSTTDEDSVDVYAYPLQEFINRLFFGGTFRPIRFWGLIKGNKPANIASVSTAINNPGVSSGPVVDNENESVIIDAEGYQLLLK